MNSQFRSSVLAFLLMVSAVGFSHALTPTRKLSDQEHRVDLAKAVPVQFADWKIDPGIVPVALSPVQAEALSSTYDQVLSRTYVNATGQRVMLSIAYGASQTQGLRAHRQEFCYTAQGFRVADIERLEFKIDGTTIEGTRMVASHGSRVEPVTYWFTMGNRVVLGYLDRQLVQLRYALSGYIPDGYLVRLSTVGPDVASGFSVQVEFAEQMMQALPRSLRDRLVGSI